jgi:hypothetical protein
MAAENAAAAGECSSLELERSILQYPCVTIPYSIKVETLLVDLTQLSAPFLAISDLVFLLPALLESSVAVAKEVGQEMPVEETSATELHTFIAQTRRFCLWGKHPIDKNELLQPDCNRVLDVRAR